MASAPDRPPHGADNLPDVRHGNAQYGLDQRTSLSTRKQIVLLLSAMLALATIIILFSLCLFRGFCAADAVGARVTYSADVSNAVVPVALILVVIVVPANVAAARLQRLGLAAIALVISATCAALLIAAGLGELGELAVASSSSSTIWAGLPAGTQSSRYGDDVGALEREVRTDMASVGVSALVLAGIAALLSLLQLGAVTRAVARVRAAQATEAERAAAADADVAGGFATGLPRDGDDDGVSKGRGLDCWALPPEAYLDDFTGGPRNDAPPCGAALYDALGLSALCAADGACSALPCVTPTPASDGAVGRSRGRACWDGIAGGVAAARAAVGLGPRPPQPPPHSQQRRGGSARHDERRAGGGGRHAADAARAAAAAAAATARQMWSALPRIRLVVDRGGSGAAPALHAPPGTHRRGSAGSADARHAADAVDGAGRGGVGRGDDRFGGAPPPIRAPSSNARRFDSVDRGAAGATPGALSARGGGGVGADVTSARQPSSRPGAATGRGGGYYY